MQTWIDRIDSDKLGAISIIGVCGIIAIILSVGIVWVLSWKRVRIREAELTFISQMASQGKNFNEIREIMTIDAKAELVKKMAGEGYSGDKIQRVLSSFDSPRNTSA